MDNDRFLEQLIENEKEWRRFVVSEIKDIKKAQFEMRDTLTTVKVKVQVATGLIATTFGAVGGSMATYLKKFFH